MPSPIQQKYSSQTHKIFGESATMSDHAPPESPKRTTTDATSSPPARRRSSAASRFANLEALKHPNTEEGAAKRAAMADSRIGHPGVVGQLWNKFTRGSYEVTKDTSGGAKDMANSKK